MPKKRLIADSCPIGTFLCQNSSLCMPQRSWCNGILDCPEGDDESIECCKRTSLAPTFSTDKSLIEAQILIQGNDAFVATSLIIS
jgi:hypothetical protein